jgi:photosystem II stability/assembly factor-like uncharacterized protein
MLKKVGIVLIIVIAALALAQMLLAGWSAAAQSRKHQNRVVQRARQRAKNPIDPDLLQIDLAGERAKYFFHRRAFPSRSIPLDWRLKAQEHLEKDPALKLRKLDAEQFTPIGPAPINDGQTFGRRQNISGRVTAIAIDPQNPALVYLGAAQGGLWRSTDAGQDWQAMTDNEPTQATGAIAIDPTNSKIIYIGTGEGSLSGDSFYGMGILKSTDGGITWKNFAAQTFVGVSFSQLIIDPKNPNTLYGAITSGRAGRRIYNPQPATNGIYKSTDGGQSWANILQVGTMPLDSSATDLAMDPTNSSVLYAAIIAQGIYKTTDGGVTWTKLGGGLPTTNFLRPSIAISKTNPSVLYSAFEDANSEDLLNIFKSADGGNSWTATTRPPRSGFGNICQCFYDNFIKIDPGDPNTVYFGGVGLFKSSNGGLGWIDLSENSIGLHADFHAFAFAANNSKNIFVGNDGGVWSSTDGGNNFTNLNATLNITQFQSISLHPTNPNIALGGTQDNGTNLYNGMPGWIHSQDGDGGFAAIDQSSPNTMYHTFFNFPGLGIGPERSDSGGGLGSWVDASAGIDQNDEVLFYAPLVIDPNKSTTLYFGTYRLYRSDNQGRGWTAISDRLTNTNPSDMTMIAISAIAVAPGSPQSIYTGSSDGAVFASQDGGQTFQNVNDNLPARFVSKIVVDPNAPKTVYVSLSGFQSGHVYKSVTGGGNWQDISGNLPDVPANALIVNPLNTNNLFVGTDVGVFRSDNGGALWQPVLGLPAVSVFDLAINANLGIVRAATHGRGVYELELPNFVDTTPPTVTVKVPNGGEEVAGNSKFNIAWQSSDDTGVVSHDIDLSTDSGATFPIAIVAGLPGISQSFVWNVPALNTTMARIRITAHDAANNQGADISDGDFSIISTPTDFSLSIEPTLQNVKAGEQTTFKINVQSMNGFSDKVGLTAQVVPNDSNISLSLSSSSVQPGNSAVLTVSTTANTPGQLYNINGAAGGSLYSIGAILNVTSPDFLISVNPLISMGAPGQTIPITVNINRTGGFTGSVNIIAPDKSSLKAIKVAITPPNISTTNASVIFNLKIKKKAAKGSKQLTFIGRDDSGRARMASFTLTIQ